MSLLHSNQKDSTFVTATRENRAEQFMDREHFYIAVIRAFPNHRELESIRTDGLEL